jgi:hypothetical protein
MIINLSKQIPRQHVKYATTVSFENLIYITFMMKFPAHLLNITSEGEKASINNP